MAINLYEQHRPREATITVSAFPDVSGDFVCDGTADDVEIQAAIAYIATLGDGKIFVERGTYAFAAGVTASTSVTIEGVDMFATVFQPAQDIDAFTITANDVTLKNFMIDHQAVGTGDGVQIAENMDRVTIDSVYMTDCYRGVNCLCREMTDLTVKNCLMVDCGRESASIKIINGHATIATSRVRVMDNTIITSQTSAIQVYCSQDLLILGVICQGNMIDSSVGAGIFFSYVDNGIISDNIIRDAGAEGITVERSMAVEIDGNTVQNSTANGIQFINIGAALCEQGVISNNVIEGGDTYSIFVRTGHRVNISNNNILVDGTNGIVVSQAASDIVIDGNVIVRPADGTNIGIDLDPGAGSITLEDVVISNNRVTGFATGIAVYWETNHVLIEGNSLRGNTAPFAFSGTQDDRVVLHNRVDGTITIPNHVILDSKPFQFQHGGTVEGTVADTEFVSATASAKGWQVDAGTDWAVALGQLPQELQQVVRIKIWAVALGAPIGGGGQMHLEIVINAGADDLAFNTEPVALANFDSETTDYVANDVVHWICGPGDDADIGSMVGGMSIEFKVIYEAGSDPDGATNAVFRTVEVEYV